jgi:hypothetical protein
MTKRYFLLLYYITGLFLSSFSQSWQSQLISINSSGQLSYTPDNDGFVIPNFSHAGYKGGGIDIPFVPVMKTISPVSGDNTAHIQAAIDEVGTLPKDANGLRGAVLLLAGKYDILGTIYVKYDGVILRGVGQGYNPSNNTIIYALKNEFLQPQRDVIILGNATKQVNGNTKTNDASQVNITSPKVAVGDYSFEVSNALTYTIGDQIIIYHPCSSAWIEAVNKGGVPAPADGEADERWITNKLPIVYNRYVKNIAGNVITIDAPVFYTLDKTISQCYIYKPNMTGTIYQVGIENLRIDIETDGGEDESHAWQAVRFKSVENAWARNCTMKSFGQSGIITEACTRSTFENCSAIDPVAIITGERMYNFNTYVYSQLNLFRNNYARNGRHHYVSNGTSSTSGNVFLRCISDATNSVSEGHRQWTQGMLYDNHKEINMNRDFVLGLYNRVDMGTGHGWAAANSVLWNCDVNQSYGKIGLQKPPTSQNYAIGCMAKTITGQPILATNFTRGYVEGQNQPGLTPESLYEAQLAARILPTTQINKVKPNKINISPTLVNDFIQVDIEDANTDTLLRIRNLTGLVLTETKTHNQQEKLNISFLPAGIYLLECVSNNESHSTKFIKK